MLLSVYKILVFKLRLLAQSRGININIVRLFQHYMRSYFNSLFNQYRFENRITAFVNKYIKNTIFLKIDLSSNIRWKTDFIIIHNFVPLLSLINIH